MTIDKDLERLEGIEADMREQAQGSQDGWLLKCTDQLRDRIKSLHDTLARLEKERDYAIRWANRAVDDVDANAVGAKDRLREIEKLLSPAAAGKSRDDGIFLIEVERVGEQDRFTIWDAVNEHGFPGFYLSKMDAIAAIKEMCSRLSKGGDNV